jgi:hypothetical protein
VKRSSAVHLVVLASAVVALEGCGNRQCVDQHNIVVDDSNCHQTSSAGYHYYSGGSGSAAVGTSADAQGTAHGVFGGAGESAAHGSGGGGEGAGAGAGE